MVRLFPLPIIHKPRESAHERCHTEDKWKELLCCIVLCFLVPSLLWDVILLPTVLLDFKRVVHKH